MKLFPAVDILDGNSVRLLYGNRNSVTVYGDPVEVAKRWVDEGAEYLHIVDLNGAFDDSTLNQAVIQKLIGAVGVPVQLGGGIKSLEKVRYCIEELGAARVIIGTAAVVEPEIIDRATELYGNRIVCGVDVKDGKVAIKGWVEESTLTAKELCLQVAKKGVETIVFTDITRDGALTGVNLDSTVQLQAETGMQIIASGGMSSLEDIISLKRENVYGAILGRALYTGDINLQDALRLTR